MVHRRKVNDQLEHHQQILFPAQTNYEMPMQPKKFTEEQLHLKIKYYFQLEKKSKHKKVNADKNRAYKS